MLIGTLVVGALVAGASAWYSTRETQVEVEIVLVKRGEVRATVSNTRAGTVDACNRARMSPIMGGQISALPVKEGDLVEKGEVLLELWNDDIRAQLTLARQEKNVATARADEACATASVSQREADRFESLRRQGLTSEESADLAQGEATSRAAACRAMKSTIRVSDAKISVAEAHLEETILRAPFSGTVAEINGEVGEVVTPSPVGVATLPTIDLIDNSCIYVSAPIDEVDAPAVSAGMEAVITLDAFPDASFSATIRRVAPYVLAQEKQARTLSVEAEFDVASENLLPGYSADVEVILNVHNDVLFIPSQAIIDNDSVLVIDDEHILHQRSIETGIANWQITEVRGGLEENQPVVLSIDREGVVPGASVSIAGISPNGTEHSGQ